MSEMPKTVLVWEGDTFHWGDGEAQITYEAAAPELADGDATPYIRADVVATMVESAYREGHRAAHPRGGGLADFDWDHSKAKEALG